MSFSAKTAVFNFAVLNIELTHYNMTNIEKYFEDRLKDEVCIVRRDYLTVLPELNNLEKAVIYWYSDGGFIGINEILLESKGKKDSPLGEYLDLALSKLPNFEGITFRGTDLSRSEIRKYQQAFDDKIIITEHSFLSTSRLRNKANQYRRTVMFEIFSKNGKLVEKVSKFVDEEEVLFRKNSNFRVLSIENKDSHVHIILREI